MEVCTKEKRNECHLKQDRRLVCVNESEAGGMVKMQGVEVVKVDMFNAWGQPSFFTSQER